MIYEINNATNIYEHLLWDIRFQNCYFLHLLRQPPKVSMPIPCLQERKPSCRKDRRLVNVLVMSSLTPCSVLTFWAAAPYSALSSSHAQPRHVVDLVRDVLINSIHPSSRACLFQKIYIINEVLGKKIFQTRWILKLGLPIICSFYYSTPFIQQLFHCGCSGEQDRHGLSPQSNGAEDHIA